MVSCGFGIRLGTKVGRLIDFNGYFLRVSQASVHLAKHATGPTLLSTILGQMPCNCFVKFFSFVLFCLAFCNFPSSFHSFVTLVLMQFCLNYNYP